MLTKDQMIREYRNAGSWPVLVLLYGTLVGTLIATAMAIV